MGEGLAAPSPETPPSLSTLQASLHHPSFFLAPQFRFFPEKLCVWSVYSGDGVSERLSVSAPSGDHITVGLPGQLHVGRLSGHRHAVLSVVHQRPSRPASEPHAVQLHLARHAAGDPWRVGGRHLLPRRGGPRRTTQKAQRHRLLHTAQTTNDPRLVLKHRQLRVRGTRTARSTSGPRGAVPRSLRR